LLQAVVVVAVGDNLQAVVVVALAGLGLEHFLLQLEFLLLPLLGVVVTVL
jgi:hypothetical protein